MIANKNPYIKEAYNHLEYISKDKQKRLEYKEREKAIRDYNAFISEARKEGLSQATKQSKIEIVKNSLKTGFTIDQIALITGLPINYYISVKRQ